jgi:hypothetical protein
MVPFYVRFWNCTATEWPKHDFFYPNQNQHSLNMIFLCKSKLTQAKINNKMGGPWCGRRAFLPPGVLAAAVRAWSPRILAAGRA